MVVPLLLAAAWIALSGEPSLANVAFGLVLGLALGRLEPRALSPRGFARLPQAAALAAFFLWELVLASVRVSARVLAPRTCLRPAILAVPIELEHDWQITLLASLVTLTPGSLSLEVAADRRTLYVHVLDCEDPEAEKRAIRAGFEARVRRLAR